jgi:hypothetical protein
MGTLKDRLGMPDNKSDKKRLTTDEEGSDSICLWRIIIKQPENDYNRAIRDLLLIHKYESINKCYVCSGKEEDCVDLARLERHPYCDYEI